MATKPDALRLIDRTLFFLACLSGVAILVLQLAEIGARLLGGSVVFSSDATGFLMAVMMFLALPEVTRLKEHITADFVVLMMGPKMRRIIEHLIAPLFSALYVAIITYLLYALMRDSFVDGVRSEGVTRLPIFIPQAIMLVGAIMMLVRLVIMLFTPPRPHRDSAKEHLQ
jgi:TRAP-type C4-dicarboxylate transport system permease small subunit